MSWSLLPTVNALLNTASSVFLVSGFLLVRRKRIAAHRACMLAACATSTLFLVSYLVYHAHAGTTRFPGTGAARTAYLAMLASHTVLAMAVPPLAVVALWLAFRDRRDAHRRVARVLLPVWLYVSVTGVAIYLVLYRFYQVSAAP